MEYNIEHIGKRYLCDNESLIGNRYYEITVICFSDNTEFVKVKYSNGSLDWVKCKDINIIDNISTSDYSKLDSVKAFAETSIKKVSNTIDDLLYRK